MLPITSISLIISAAILGVLIGRFSKKPVKKVETKIKMKKLPLHFVAIAGEANPESLIEIAKAGEPVFVNVKPLRTSPMSRTRFLNSLGREAKKSGLQLSEVMKELILLTDGKQIIRVKTLTEIVSKFDDDSAVKSALNKVAQTSIGS